MKKLKKVVKIPIYTGSLTIIQRDNLKGLQKEYDLDRTTEDCNACFFSKPDKNLVEWYFICFEGKPNPSIIAHECVHFVNRLFSHHAISLDLDNDEPQAYLLEWAVEQCHKHLNLT